MPDGDQVPYPECWVCGEVARPETLATDGGVDRPTDVVDCPADCGIEIERTATAVIGHLELDCPETNQ